MPALAEKLTFPEFQSNYERSERSYEYWYGQAVPKGPPTWMHGLLQGIIMQLLSEVGYLAGAEVELRIAPEAHPKPDVIATKGEIEDHIPLRQSMSSSRFSRATIRCRMFSKNASLQDLGLRVHLRSQSRKPAPVPLGWNGLGNFGYVCLDSCDEDLAAAR
jgi:Putative restriction endonuclease